MEPPLLGGATQHDRDVVGGPWNASPGLFGISNRSPMASAERSIRGNAVSSLRMPSVRAAGMVVTK